MTKIFFFSFTVNWHQSKTFSFGTGEHKIVRHNIGAKMSQFSSLTKDQIEFTRQRKESMDPKIDLQLILEDTKQTTIDQSIISQQQRINLRSVDELVNPMNQQNGRHSKDQYDHLIVFFCVVFFFQLT